MEISKSVLALYQKHLAAMNALQDVLLLVLRVYIGYRFAMAGWGKLQNVDQVVGFFTDLGIPAPRLNVYLAGGTEFVGGILLCLGAVVRVACVPLVFTMLVAYLTADLEAVKNIFSDPDKFLKAEPFLFLLTSLLVLFFGAGKFSLDAFWGKRKS